MKATISLKQLRTNPRAYVRLLTSGYEVEITEHRKTLVKASQTAESGTPKPGDVGEILRVIRSLPKLEILDPKLDTVSAVRKAKADYLSAKQERLSLR